MNAPTSQRLAQGEPAPNWCSTCGKHRSDPLAIVCSNPVHLPTQPPHHDRGEVDTREAALAAAELVCAMCADEGEARKINNGRCEDFANALHASLEASGLECTQLDTDNFTAGGRWDRELLKNYWGVPLERPLPSLIGHRWLYSGGRHFDAEAPYGVACIFDLPIFLRATAALTEAKQQGAGEVLARGWFHALPEDDYEFHDDASGAGKNCPGCIRAVIVREAPQVEANRREDG